MKIRKMWLALWLLGASLGWLAGPSWAQGRSLHFLVFGDWGSGTQQQKDIAETMARYADQHKTTDPVQLIVSVGDNFYEDGVAGVDDPQWQTKFEQIYDKQRLNVPFIAVLGNHDWRGDPMAEIAYPVTHPGTRWQMDGFWFKRQFPAPASLPAGTAPLADFFFIDSDLWEQKLKILADRQASWLKSGLKDSTARWQLVFAHHPLYSNGEHGHDKPVLDLRALLGPVFTQWGVDAYITGHDHDLQRIEVPGVPTKFIISGAGGKLRSKQFDDWKPFYAATPGFAAITLSETEMRGQFLDAGGQTLDSWVYTPVPPSAAPLMPPVMPALPAIPAAN